MTSVVIVAAKRTPIGSFLGSLSTTSSIHLGASVISDIVDNSNLSSDEICEAYIGQVLTAGLGQNTARQSILSSGLSKKTPAFTINQVCGSGLQSVILATKSILSNSAKIVIAGGQENMSLAKHVTYARKGAKMGNIELVDTMVYDGLTDIFNNYHMGITAENLAQKYNISKEEQDIFAYNSQDKTRNAINNKLFDDEIVPIDVKSRKSTHSVNIDEFPKHDATLEGIQSVRSAFIKDGTVSAANASGINDGAAMLLVMSEEEASKRNLKPLARIVSFAHSGCDPTIMGIGPVDAVKSTLKKANWTIDDLDLIEANEAFAVQSIAVNKELGWNTDIINVNGGAIALGHPIGASGARILVTLLHEMNRRNAKKALATLCVGGGMGVALAVEAV